MARKGNLVKNEYDSDFYSYILQGETKGKEIDLATLLLVNPSLAKDTHHDTKGKVAKNGKYNNCMKVQVFSHPLLCSYIQQELFT
jgi:hypothetical protein